MTKRTTTVSGIVCLFFLHQSSKADEGDFEYFVGLSETGPEISGMAVVDEREYPILFDQFYLKTVTKGGMVSSGTGTKPVIETTFAFGNYAHRDEARFGISSEGTYTIGGAGDKFEASVSFGETKAGLSSKGGGSTPIRPGMTLNVGTRDDSTFGPIAGSNETMGITSEELSGYKFNIERLTGSINSQLYPNQKETDQRWAEIGRKLGMTPQEIERELHIPASEAAINPAPPMESKIDEEPPDAAVGNSSNPSENPDDRKISRELIEKPANVESGVKAEPEGSGGTPARMFEKKNIAHDFFGDGDAYEDPKEEEKGVPKTDDEKIERMIELAQEILNNGYQNYHSLMEADKSGLLRLENQDEMLKMAKLSATPEAKAELEKDQAEMKRLVDELSHLPKSVIREKAIKIREGK